MRQPRLCVKFNSFPGMTTCPICQQPVKSWLGPEVFIEGTGQIVCNLCSAQHAPALAALSRMAVAGMAYSTEVHKHLNEIKARGIAAN